VCALASAWRRALLACTLLAIASLTGVARAEDAGAIADCSKDFNTQVAEAMWLRDADPQSAGDPPAAASDARTLFNLAILIDDLQVLRAQSGTASWPRALSRLSSQELRRRRDAPALDPTACEIVRFMLEHYSAERERDGLPLARTAIAEPVPSAPPPAPRPAVRVASAAPPDLPRTEVRPSAPKPRPAEKPAALPPPAPSAQETPRPERAPEPERPRLAEAPRLAETPRLAEPRLAETPRLEETPRVTETPRLAETAPLPVDTPPRLVETASLPDEDTPAPPPAVVPPDPTPLPPVEIERPVLESERPALGAVQAPVEQEPSAAPSPAVSESAKVDLAALEAQLAAPRYLTLRAMRRNAASRPDEEVWRLRRQTLQARDELVRLLRKFASDPARLGAVKTLLGAQGCTRVEKRIKELYAGGPDAEKGDLALELWKRQPNPD
jgi:hypothetical protein